MAKPRAVVRQWTLLRVLSQQKNGLTISEMAKYMDVNDRTIRRDINLFVEAGVPLREAVGPRGKKVWRVEDRSSLAVPTHSIDEALALAVAEQLLTSLRGTRLYTATKRCREKVTASLSISARTLLEEQVAKLRREWNGECLLPPSFKSLDSLWNAVVSRC